MKNFNIFLICWLEDWATFLPLLYFNDIAQFIIIIIIYTSVHLFLATPLT